MKWKKQLGSVSLLVAWLLLAALGWARYVVMHPVERGRLAGLIVSAPPAGFARKPASSSQVAGSSSPFASVKSLAKRSPGSTGAYSVTWDDPKAGNNSATILVTYLPSSGVAKEVQAQARTQFLGSGSFKSQNYIYAGPVAIAGVPESGGAVFRASGSATTPPVAAVVFTTGRVQVLELIGRTGTTANAGAIATALARSESAHLRRDLPGFHLRTTSVPLVATVIYWAVALGIVVLAVAIPRGIGLRRRRRREARLRSARRQHQVRGSKIARRQARRR